MILGIDASTAGSGGAKRHLIELINNFHPSEYGFTEIHIWGADQLLQQLPVSEGVCKYTHPLLNNGTLSRIIWQLFYRESTFKNRFDVLFSPFGTYTGFVKPYVSMSRNMLVFEKKERKRFGVSLLGFKFRLLFLIQKRSFSKAEGVIFLSRHAMNIVVHSIGIADVKMQIIHHGISDDFRKAPRQQREISSYSQAQPFRLLYVSTVWVYKHPWNVAEAVSNLRKKGYPIVFDFVGNNEQVTAGDRFAAKIKECDPDGQFIQWYKNIGLKEVAAYYHKADAFVFASTCENMPNILIEAMSAGLPVVCSFYEPMPEFLQEAGIYMDPTDAVSIELALEKMLKDTSLREKSARLSFEQAKAFSWSKCATETFHFLYQTASQQKNNN